MDLRRPGARRGTGTAGDPRALDLCVVAHRLQRHHDGLRTWPTGLVSNKGVGGANFVSFVYDTGNR